jgi:hypothetical protein
MKFKIILISFSSSEFFSFLGKFNESVTSSGTHQEYKLEWNFCDESILELLYDQKLASSNDSIRRFKVRNK